MTSYILHRAADEDLVCGAHYIRRDNPEAAAQFLGRAYGLSRPNASAALWGRRTWSLKSFRWGAQPRSD
jgi:plasmid stabilization system protein ParE